MIGEDDLIIGCPDARNETTFGPIEDFQAGGNYAFNFFSKMWEEDMPSKIFINVASRVMPIAWEPKSFVKVTVK